MDHGGPLNGNGSSCLNSATNEQLTMPLQSRNRMVSFRLTAEEYDRFRELCFAHGVRSVSEMARTAINLLLGQPVRAGEALESRVAEMEGRIHMLALQLKQLNQVAAVTPMKATEEARLPG